MDSRLMLTLGLLLLASGGEALDQQALEDSLRNFPELLHMEGEALEKRGVSFLRELSQGDEGTCSEPECANAADLSLWVEALYDGVTEVPIFENYGDLMTFGPRAFPLLRVNGINILAGSELGSGRVLAASHPGYGSKNNPRSKRSAKSTRSSTGCLSSALGKDYTGSAATTISGKTCQPWAAQQPHQHSIGDEASEFPNDSSLEAVSNYCRNPDGEPRPWCYTSDPDKRWDYCDIPFCPDYNQDCREDEKGWHYRGDVSSTRSGKTCQSWLAQTPNSHSYTDPKKFPDATLVDASNFCRNPDMGDTTWCYTTDPDTRWEYCDVPFCELPLTDGRRLNKNMKNWASKGGYENEENVCYLKTASDMSCLSDSKIKVVVFTGGDWPTDAQTDQLAEWVKTGGGLIYAHKIWAWKHYTVSGKAGMSLDAVGFYKVIEEAGIAYSTWYHNYKQPLSPPSSQEDIRELMMNNWPIAISQIKSVDDITENSHIIDNWKAKLSDDIVFYPSMKKSVSKPFETLATKFESQMPWPQGTVQDNSNEVSVSKAQMGMFKIYAAMDEVEMWKAKGPTVHKFPGDVPDVPTKEYEGEFQGRKAKYHNTGMYLPAGKPMTIEVLNHDSADSKKFQIVIGCHMDTLFKKDKLRRFPQIRRYVLLKERQTTVNTKYGGCVFVWQGKHDSDITLMLKLTGVVKMPYLDINDDASRAEWESRKNSPAPWGVIESQWMMVTLPTSAMQGQTVDKIDQAMRRWDQVVVSDYELKDAPEEYRRQQFFGPDIQISVGWMHSGYPIGTHLDKATPDNNNFVVNLDGFEDQWGLYHEVGHNMQDSWWTYAKTGETTVNIFSLYQFWKLDHEKHAVLKQLESSIKSSHFHSYLANPSFDACFSSPWTPLLPYAQFAHHFGWQCYTKVFSTYYTDHDQIQTNQDEMDQWVIRTSRAVGYNLSPLWDFFSLKISDSTYTLLSDLPAFLPDDVITQKPEAATLVSALETKYGSGLKRTVDNKPDCARSVKTRKSRKLRKLLKELEKLM